MPVELEIPTICTSMTSSLTIYVGKSTSTATLAKIRNELLSFIQNSMERYESASVRQIIVKDLGASSLETGFQGSEIISHLSKTGSGSTLLIFIYVIASMIVVVFCSILCVSLKRKRENACDRRTTDVGYRWAKRYPGSNPSYSIASSSFKRGPAWQEQLDEVAYSDYPERAQNGPEEERLSRYGGAGESLLEPPSMNMIIQLSKAGRVDEYDPLTPGNLE